MIFIKTSKQPAMYVVRINVSASDSRLSVTGLFSLKAYLAW